MAKGQKGRQQTRSTGRGKRNQRNNFQDKFAEQEKLKGEKQVRGNVPITTGSCDNDPSWYRPNAQIVKDVASIPTGYPVGKPIQLNKSMTANPTVVQRLNATELPIPGIMVYDIVPVFGDAFGDSLDPMNLAATQLFQTVRSATSGTAYYRAADMMVMNIAVAQAYSLYNWMIRIYGEINNVQSPYNRYLPKALVTAMGVDYDNIAENISDYRAYCNLFANSLSKLYVPKDFDYLKRQVFLYESVYTDSNTNKAQIYLYNPVGFYVLHEGEISTSGEPIGTYLKFERLVTRPNYDVRSGLERDIVYPIDSATVTAPMLTFDDIKTYAESLLRPLVNSEDLDFIGADYIKAFGLGNMYQVAPIAETYTVAPNYSSEILEQMSNAHVLPQLGISSDLRLEKQTGINSNSALYGRYTLTDRRSDTDPVSFNITAFNNQLNEYSVVNDRKIVLNWHREDISPDDVMVSTRLANDSYNGKTAVVSAVDGKTQIPSFSLETMGTEIACGAWAFTLHAYSTSTGLENVQLVGQELPTNYFMATPSPTNNNVPVSSIMTVVNKVCASLASFDWHHKVRFAWGNGNLEGVEGQSKLTVGDYIFDIDTFTIISTEELKLMNETALIGEFTHGAEKGRGSIG